MFPTEVFHAWDPCHAGVVPSNGSPRHASGGVWMMRVLGLDLEGYRMCGDRIQGRSAGELQMLFMTRSTFGPWSTQATVSTSTDS